MDKPVTIRVAHLPKAKKLWLIAVCALFVAGVVLLQIKLTFTQNSVAAAKNDVQTAVTSAKEEVQEASPTQNALEQFKETLEITP